MGGLVGRMVLDLSGAPDLWPFLWHGQWLHAGKGATMGMGAYRLLPVA
jgi:CRISPR/Cas system endoribonuclease Cas6 (RAMP superfamily)